MLDTINPLIADYVTGWWSWNKAPCTIFNKSLIIMKHSVTPNRIFLRFGKGEDIEEEGDEEKRG